jgi:hypothetical protein
MKKSLSYFVLPALASTSAYTTIANAAVIFSENVGTPSATTAVASYTGFQNAGTLAFTGTADVRTSGASTGYAGSSGSGNVFFTNNGTSSFQIGTINTSLYTSGSIDLSFGAFKSTTASNMSEFKLEYSSDGTTYTTLSIPAQATGTGTAVWRLISFVNTAIPATSNLRLRWTNTSTGPQFRLDDIKLEGDLAAGSTISLTSSPAQTTNVATGDSITVLGASGSYTSEIDELKSASVAKGFAPVSSIGNEAGTDYVMLWTDGNVTTIPSLNTNGGTIITSGTIFNTLQGAYPGFDILISYANFSGTKNVDFDFSSSSVRVDKIAVVPEPATVGLAGVGALGLLTRRRRKA